MKKAFTPLLRWMWAVLEPVMAELAAASSSSAVDGPLLLLAVLTAICKHPSSGIFN